ncbi:hypothetical protein ACS0TY_033684 [Phlomoides rotata]
MGKLKRLKHVLKTWNKEVFWDIDRKIATAKDTLTGIQAGIYEEGDSNRMMNLEFEATVTLHQFLAQQHAFFAQKNCTDWLRDGDRNSVFFHKLHRIRKARAGINAMNVDGLVTTDLGLISNHIVRFYTDLFRASNREPPDFSVLHDLISPVVSDSKNNSLVSCPSSDEVKAAVHALSEDSAPGPDGFGGSFFQKMWEASIANTHRLKSILDRYADLSGQLFNPPKSKVYFGKHVPAHNWHYIHTTLGIGLGDPPFPTSVSLYSEGCPKLCISSVLPIAFLLSLLLGKILLYRWQAAFAWAMRSFIWTGNIEKSDFFSISWALASKDEGGLGIRSITLLNAAFLQKLAWSILTNNEPAMDFVCSRILAEAWWILERTSVVRFWLDNWMGYIIADRIGIPHFAKEFLAFSVSDYYFDGAWHLDEFFVMKHMDIVEDMLWYSCKADSDTLVWPHSVHGTLTSKVAYAGLQQRYPMVSWGNWIRGPFIPTKRSTVIWRLNHGKLPTWDFLHFKGFSGPSQCVFCYSAIEDLDNLSSLCPWIRHFISKVTFIFNVNLHFDYGFGHWMLQATRCAFSPQISALWRLYVVTIIWII